MKLKASLPTGDLNGLGAVHSQLIKQRGKKVLIIGAVTSHEFTDIEGKGREAKVELVRVEAVPPDLQEYIAELIERALEDRTGQTALDLEIEGTTDLRKEFKPRKKPDDPQPELFQPPAALTTGTDEDVVDAEVIDEADENAAEAEAVSEEAAWDAAAPAIPTSVFGDQAGFVDEPDADESDDEHAPSLDG